MARDDHLRLCTTQSRGLFVESRAAKPPDFTFTSLYSLPRFASTLTCQALSFTPLASVHARSKHAINMTDDTRASGSPFDPEFEQRLVDGWQHVHDGNNDSNVSDIFHVPAMTPPTAPLSTVPPHRKWVDLSILEFPAVTTMLNDLTERCAFIRSFLDNALTDLETVTQIYVSKYAPMSIEEHEDYTRSFSAAIAAGRRIFPPQEAYRCALTTLGMFVTDLIDALPENSRVRQRVRKAFEEGMAEANGKEEGIRKSLRGLVTNTSKGGESYALAVYMDMAQQRLTNWSAQEDNFKTWASECMVALV
ncbi:hypothetical protein CC86DRAFT_384658 [Ophiobolus disseminans]|uniref:Uncharacterized protein n=1 Tax=Ophiobolus disseminans TaxID=1469910 RepID=A0A6A6ZSK4_9PLEO|nr:hypothetical protein CC86DRAFT_384658 [Ophiobolus disseminans]